MLFRHLLVSVRTVTTREYTVRTKLSSVIVKKKIYRAGERPPAPIYALKSLFWPCRRYAWLGPLSAFSCSIPSPTDAGFIPTSTSSPSVNRNYRLSPPALPVPLAPAKPALPASTARQGQEHRRGQIRGPSSGPQLQTPHR